MLVLLSVLIAGCGTPTPVQPHAVFTVEPHTEGGTTLAIVPGSQVQRTDGVLTIDMPGGMRWADIRYVDNPQIAIPTWSSGMCEGIVWDRQAEPVDGVSVRTGLCTRQGQIYWTFLALEPHSEQVLMTTYLAHRDRTRLEDAWVEFVTSVLSAQGADTPLVTIDEVEVRRRLRGLPPEATGRTQIPGGGELGAAMAEALSDVFEARRRAAPPQL